MNMMNSFGSFEINFKIEIAGYSVQRRSAITAVKFDDEDEVVAMVLHRCLLEGLY